jgi:hypothetical protein
VIDPIPCVTRAWRTQVLRSTKVSAPEMNESVINYLFGDISVVLTSSLTQLKRLRQRSRAPVILCKSMVNGATSFDTSINLEVPCEISPRLRDTVHLLKVVGGSRGHDSSGLHDRKYPWQQSHQGLDRPTSRMTRFV